MIPDFGVTDFGTHVCRAQVTRVGSNLPCLEYTASASGFRADIAVTNISATHRLEDDYAALALGPACPGQTGGDTTDSQFTIMGCVELPVGQPGLTDAGKIHS